MGELKTALLELHYFPSVQFFSKFLCYPHILIEGEDHYVKRSYRNRCHLASPEGIHRLSVPLKKGKNRQMPYRKVAISYDQPWHIQHWRSIQSLYGKAPFFPDYAGEIKDVLLSEYPKLFDLNRQLLITLLKLLDISMDFDFTRQYETEPEKDLDDYRPVILPRAAPPNFGDPSFFPLPYPQLFIEHSGFLPNLSILDLLFCTGPEAKLILKRCCLMSG